jgi:hypothetical protein
MLEDLTPPPKPGTSCKVATVLETLSPSDGAILLEAIANKDDWPIKTLKRALQAKGLMISDTPLTSHRAQTCICYRVG